MFSIIDGFGLFFCSISGDGEYNHLKKRINCILYVLYVPIHLCNGSTLSIFRKLSRNDNISSLATSLKSLEFLKNIENVHSKIMVSFL